MAKNDDENQENPPKRKKGNLKKKALIAAAVSLTGLSAAAVAGAVLGYDAVFSRYERPDYALTAGVYC